jgi:hypothetical protein
MENNIRKAVKEIGWEGVDWIQLSQDADQWRAYVKPVMNPPASVKGGESPD